MASGRAEGSRRPGHRAYDVVKDIVRVEKFIAGRDGADGTVIVLANDASYCRPTKPDDASNAAAFRVSDGVVLSGSRAWGHVRVKGRIDALDILGRYEMHWSDYARLPGGGLVLICGDSSPRFAHRRKTPYRRRVGESGAVRCSDSRYCSLWR